MEKAEQEPGSELNALTRRSTRQALVMKIVTMFGVGHGRIKRRRKFPHNAGGSAINHRCVKADTRWTEKLPSRQAREGDVRSSVIDL